MIVLGLILLLIGVLVGIPLLYYIGAVLLVVGIALWFVPIGGSTRRWY